MNIIKFLQNEFLINIILTFLLVILFIILRKFTNIINQKVIVNEKQIYKINKRNKAIMQLIFFTSFILIWHKEFNNLITLISFISAALTLAIRDIIYNYFCGIYIKILKPFKLEDRIKVGEIIGDVININELSFELLEVDARTNQSTGKIIHLPNSQIFSLPIKNYTTAFKYVWHEMSIKISFVSDYAKVKEILNKIIASNVTIRDIPKKMKNEMKKSSSNYRIYYNNFSPIIYTKIDDKEIVLTMRFLMHPKKIRIVENEIYEKIIEEFKKHNIN